MKVSTPIEYTDQSGKIMTDFIKEDGVEIMELRGVTFTNNGRSGFRPTQETPANLLSSFMLADGVLSGYSIKFLEKLPRTLWGRKDVHFQVLNPLLDDLDSKLPIRDQEENLQPFKSLSDDQIGALVNEAKDEEAGMALYFIGPSRMGHWLPQLLTNLQDQNWPAFGWNMKLLADIGEALIPEIKNVFENEPNDTIWHDNIILLLSHWDRQLVGQVKTELINAVLKGDLEGASISALHVLHEKQLIDANQSSKYYNFLADKYGHTVHLLEDLKELAAIINTNHNK